MGRLSPFVRLCRPYRALSWCSIYQGFTPLAISCRPFGAPERVHLLQWQDVSECGRHLRCRIRKECAESGQIPLSAFTRNFPVR